VKTTFNIGTFWDGPHAAVLHDLLVLPSLPLVQTLGFIVQGLGCRVWGLGFRIQGVGFGV